MISVQTQYTPLKLPLGRLALEKSRKERSTIRWRSIDPEANRYRYYSISVHEDLWGDRCLILGWGRINAQPQHKYIWPESDAELEQLIDKVFQMREKHRYEVVV